jgi:hypothetical protein
MNQHYICTIRLASFDSETHHPVAHTTGVDVLLEENDGGRLVFPNEMFQEVKVLLLEAEQTGGALQ